MPEPGKKNVLGVLVDAVDLPAAVTRVIESARFPRSFAVSALAVHGLMSSVQDETLRRCVNDLDLVVADGQPVRWALNLLYDAGLATSVRGTDLTLGVVRAAAKEDLPVFVYGSRPDVLRRFIDRLCREAPGLEVAGSEPSLFSTVDLAHQSAIAERIRASGARLVLVGLGCPRQELFVHAMRERLGMPALAVGAAFDYLAGTLREPPAVLKRWGLEWAWRLGLEPGRLWKRYLLLNPAYLALLSLQRLGLVRPRVLVGGVEAPARIAA
jgi:N-acetylglucosaminyldiphosphoundecaprenol N-acetyl-beta-D-mannosaminyltransferase